MAEGQKRFSLVMKQENCTKRNQSYQTFFFVGLTRGCENSFASSFGSVRFRGQCDLVFPQTKFLITRFSFVELKIFFEELSNNCVLFYSICDRSGYSSSH